MRYFIIPPRGIFASAPCSYSPQFSTYAEYNYVRGGIIPSLKRRRFEAALSMARGWFGKANVIDMGCADGVFLPSLSHYFPNVIAVDRDADRLRVAAKVVSDLRLNNVRLVCNQGMSTGQLRRELGLGCELMFLLETLEHVGTKEAMYESKGAFVNDMLSLLSGDGTIIASVPRMVGLPFLAKYFIQAVTGMQREAMSGSEILRSGLLKNTDALEKRWVGSHAGFNENKLTQHLQRYFDTRVFPSLTSVLYEIRRGWTP